MKGIVQALDPRGWIGLAVFILVLVLLGLITTVPELRQDEFFKTIATLLIGSFVKDVVGWAYTATKQGGELADRAANLAEKHADTKPPIVATSPPVIAGEEIPDYAKP